MKKHFNFNTANDGGSEEETAGAEVSLADVPPGHECVVGGVSGQSPASRRLADLGLLAGTHVRVVRRAPLGDPVVYELRGYRLCLRRKDAGRVWIRPNGHTSAAPI